MNSREIIRAALMGFDVYGYDAIGIPINLWIEAGVKAEEWRAACKNMCKTYELRTGEKDRDSVFAKGAAI